MIIIVTDLIKHLKIKRLWNIDYQVKNSIFDWSELKGSLHLTDVAIYLTGGRFVYRIFFKT